MFHVHLRKFYILLLIFAACIPSGSNTILCWYDSWCLTGTLALFIFILWSSTPKTRQLQLICLQVCWCFLLPAQICCWNSLFSSCTLGLRISICLLFVTSVCWYFLFIYCSISYLAIFTWFSLALWVYLRSLILSICLISPISVFTQGQFLLLSFPLNRPRLCVYLISCLSCVWLLLTLWTVAHQAPLSMGFIGQEYCSGFPWPPSMGSSQPRDWNCISVSTAMTGRFFTVEPPGSTE